MTIELKINGQAARKVKKVGPNSYRAQIKKKVFILIDISSMPEICSKAPEIKE